MGCGLSKSNGDAAATTEHKGPYGIVITGPSGVGKVSCRIPSPIIHSNAPRRCKPEPSKKSVPAAL